MKVFLSWSGNRSKAVAELFATWLPLVVQRLEPWISTEIDKGAPWLEELTSEIGKAGTGIVCLTKENRTAPWILFEAGALAKGLSRNRVCTFLVDFEAKDLDKPLSQFQATLPQKADILALVSTLNSQLPETEKLAEDRLAKCFEAFWPQFENPFKKICEEQEAVAISPPRPVTEVLNDILDTVRGLERKMEDGNSSDAAWRAFRRQLDLHVHGLEPQADLLSQKSIDNSPRPNFGFISDDGVFQRPSRSMLTKMVTDEAVRTLLLEIAKLRRRLEDVEKSEPPQSAVKTENKRPKRKA